MSRREIHLNFTFSRARHQQIVIQHYTIGPFHWHSVT